MDIDLELNELASKTDKDSKIRSNHRAFVARKRTQEATSETARKSAETARLMEYVALIRERGLLAADQDVSSHVSSSKPVLAFARNALMADLAAIERQTSEKSAQMDSVLKENAQLRREIAELRAQQIGFDDHIVAFVAPNRKRVLESRALGGAHANEMQIRNHLARQSRAALEAEARKKQTLKAQINAVERQLTRDSQRVVELEREHEDARLEVAQLERTVAEHQKTLADVVRRVERWRSKISSEEREYEAELRKRLEAESKELRREVRTTISAVQADALKRQREAARREAHMASARLERNLREAVAIGKDVANLKKELERLRQWTSVRNDVQAESELAQHAGLRVVPSVNLLGDSQSSNALGSAASGGGGGAEHSGSASATATETEPAPPGKDQKKKEKQRQQQ